MILSSVDKQANKRIRNLTYIFPRWRFSRSTLYPKLRLSVAFQVSNKCPNVKHEEGGRCHNARRMIEQQISGAGNEAGAGEQISGETREPMQPKRRGLAEEGLIVDLVVKPVKELVKSVLPPEVQEALGIRETPKQEKKPPIIIVINPGKTPETTTTGAAGAVRQPVTPRIKDRPSMIARHLPGAGASQRTPAR